MSPVLPFEIIALIIGIIGENGEGTSLLKEFALVSHSFLQICSKHLFATVELYDADPICCVASSKRGFLKLLKSRPDVVKYIRKLTYKVTKVGSFSNFNDDHLLSPILGTIPRLNCLTIDASDSDWNNLDSSLTSALLHLMSLPTINHIDLSNIINFPPSCFTLSVNLHRLDMLWLNSLDGDDFSDGNNNSPKIIVLSEMLPRIREFRSLHSFLSTDLLHAKLQDGRPAFNFMDLRRFSMSLTFPEDERDIRYLLQNAKLLEELHLFVGPDWSLVDLHDILSPSAGFLKVLGLTVSLDSVDLELCEELEAMAGHNMLEAVSFEVEVGVDETEDDIGPIIQNVLKELVRPGWSALRQVSIKLIVTWCWNSEELSEALQFLPDKYLSDLLKLESVVFNYSVCVDQNN